MDNDRAITALAAYLRLGQPPAAPSTGYSALLALMPQRLTDADIDILAGQFAEQREAPVSDIDIGVAIMTITDDVANRTDVDRVRRSLFGRQ